VFNTTKMTKATNLLYKMVRKFVFHVKELVLVLQNLLSNDEEKPKEDKGIELAQLGKGVGAMVRDP
jgi:hypothetical protein